MSEYPIIKTPTRSYPLPDNIRSLDEPWPEVIKGRHTRVKIYKEGHTPTDDPLRDKPNVSPSKILSKL